MGRRIRLTKQIAMSDLAALASGSGLAMAETHPIDAKTFDEDEIVEALRQNGWFVCRAAQVVRAEGRRIVDLYELQMSVAACGDMLNHLTRMAQSEAAHLLRENIPSRFVLRKCDHAPGEEGVMTAGISVVLPTPEQLEKWRQPRPEQQERAFQPPGPRRV